jgi:hypothetical protein
MLRRAVATGNRSRMQAGSIEAHGAGEKPEARPLARKLGRWRMFHFGCRRQCRWSTQPRSWNLFSSNSGCSKSMCPDYKSGRSGQRNQKFRADKRGGRKALKSLIPQSSQACPGVVHPRAAPMDLAPPTVGSGPSATILLITLRGTSLMFSGLGYAPSVDRNVGSALPSITVAFLL